MNFSWAENYPDLYKVCRLFSLSELSNPLNYCYKPVQYFIQEGPQCGLVALAMYLGHPSEASVGHLLEVAKKKGFSNHGEMFSAENMSNLAKSEAPKNHKIGVYSGPLNTEEIKKMLLKGAKMLVPYDCDKNHTPCLLNGLKAHWALICGAVQTEEDFFVLVYHGKTKNIGVWRLSDLSDSNSQLNEVGSYEKNPELQFKVPEGGIQGPLGLKEKSVILCDCDFNNQ